MSDNTKNEVKSEASPLEFKNYKSGFWRGYGQVQQKDVLKIRTKLFKALGLSMSSPMNFSHYLTGKYEPKASAAQAIEAVFAEYGITDVWGPKEYSNRHDKVSS